MCSSSQPTKSITLASRRVAAAVGVITFIATLLIWWVLILQQSNQLQQTMELAATSTKTEISQELSESLQTLANLTMASSVPGPLSGPRWRETVELIGPQLSGCQEIGWLDPSLELRWAEPTTGDGEVKTLVAAPPRSAAMQAAVSQRTVTISPAVELAGNVKGVFVFAPIYRDLEFSGLLVAVFQLQASLDAALDDLFNLGYAAAVFEGTNQIYLHTKAPEVQANAQFTKETTLNFHGTTWRVRVWPEPELRARFGQSVSNAVLFGGMILAVTLMIVVRVMQTKVLSRSSPDVRQSEVE